MSVAKQQCHKHRMQQAEGLKMLKEKERELNDKREQQQRSKVSGRGSALCAYWVAPYWFALLPSTVLPLCNYTHVCHVHACAPWQSHQLLTISHFQ
jgi:hypothetical protein